MAHTLLLFCCCCWCCCCYTYELTYPVDGVYGECGARGQLTPTYQDYHWAVGLRTQGAGWTGREEGGRRFPLAVSIRDISNECVICLVISRFCLFLGLVCCPWSLLYTWVHECQSKYTAESLYQGPYEALKVLKSLEFDWTKFKALKSLNFTQSILEKSWI